MSPDAPEPDESPGRRPITSDPAAVACLNRTRAAVLNIIVATGLVLVVSGFVIREFDLGMPRFPEVPARRVAYGVLLGLVVLSYATRRALSSRSALRDPVTRGPRFYLAHVAGALIGSLAVPLGFVYGAAVRPDLREIAPFWVAGMALGFLALPRGHELEDFDEPMADPRRPNTSGDGRTGASPPTRARRPRR